MKTQSNPQLRRSLLVVSALTSLFATGQTSAGTATSNLTVSSSIAANCTISTAAVAFGAYDPIVTNLAAALNGTGTITTTCTTGSSPVITLGQGANADTGSTDAVPLRQMANGSERMAYALFSNAGRTTTWGNTSGTAPAAVTGTGIAQNFTVYGQIAGGQNLPTGSYSDTVVATVTF